MASLTEQRAADGRRDLGDLLLRSVLVLVALMLIWFAQLRFEAWAAEYQQTFRWQTLPQLQWLGLLGLAGLAFGFAAWPPARGRYRWMLALLLALGPTLLIVQYFVAFGVAPSSRRDLPAVLFRVTSFANRGPLFVLPMLVGLAVAAGFSRRSHPSEQQAEGSEASDRSPR